MSAGRKYRRQLHLGPDLADGMPHDVKEGIVRRRLVVATGVCPCGARLNMPDDLEAGQVVRVAVYHEDDCPAGAPRLRKAIAAWEGRAP